MGKLLLALGVLSFVPVWRSPNAPGEQLTFWQFFQHQNGIPHIPYNEAVEEARWSFRNGQE